MFVHGTPGASALDGYRAARKRRRRQLAWLLVIGAAAVTGVLVLAGPLPAVLGVLVLVVTVWMAGSSDPERWLRGAAGEQATARILDRLPRRRWTVRHDLGLPGSRANVDHLVIGRTGVWVVDTKATRAQVRTRWRQVYLGSRRLDAGPTEWEAQIVSDRLGVPVRPLIAVQGPMATRRARAGGIPVVPAAQVVRRLRRGRRRLTRTEIKNLTARVDEVLVQAGPARAHHG